jgi:hypothetical protein
MSSLALRLLAPAALSARFLFQTPQPGGILRDGAPVGLIVGR